MANEQKINVLHVDTGKDWRGGQRQVLSLHMSLLKNGISSHLCCHERGKLLKMALDQKVNNIHTINFKGALSIKTHLDFSNICKKVKPNIINFHDSHSLSLGIFIKKNAKLIATRRVSYPINLLSRYTKYKVIDLHIAVSNEIKNYLSNFYNQVICINSCIDLNRFKIKKRELFDKDNINLLYVGAFSEQKGLDILLPAFQKISLTNNKIFLHLVGEGHLLNWAKQEVDKLNLQFVTKFYGSKRNIEDFYLSSDIVICPSTSGEGSSGVIKEALAAGKITIASDLECNKEIIENNYNGFLFENRNANKLYLKIKESIDGKSELKKLNLEKSIEKFSCTEQTKKYIKTYKEILCGTI